MKTPHKHAELIKAWADGADIELLDGDVWLNVNNPSWSDEYIYRIKPQPKPDVVRYGRFACESYLSRRLDDGYHNTKFTFDGETGKLKSAEVL